MSLAERRHHEERIKARFRGVFRWVKPTHRKPSWAEVERQAVRFAHHSKCPCWLCRKPRYNRRRDAPEE